MAVGVKHRRHAKGAEVRGLYLVEKLLAGGNIRAADPHGHRGEIVGRAREERSLDQAAHRLRLHVSVAEQNVDPRVLGHDGVEGTRMLIGVEL
jgi:hypothetical protein